MITHTFLLFGNPDCTGHLLHRAFWQDFFGVIRGLRKVLSVNVPMTHINCLGNNFPIARTFVTQKNCFRIIYVYIYILCNHFGPHSMATKRKENNSELGEACLLTVGAFLLTLKLLCSQSLKALIRRTLPL